MGAWGAEPFENDTAQDWLVAAEENAAVVLAAFDEARGSDYLDADVGANVVAAAALVAAAIDGDVGGLPEAARELVPTLRLDEALRRRAAEALASVLGQRSELRELWDESEDGTHWREVVARLRARIVGGE